MGLYNNEREIMANWIKKAPKSYVAKRKLINIGIDDDNDPRDGENTGEAPAYYQDK